MTRKTSYGTILFFLPSENNSLIAIGEADENQTLFSKKNGKNNMKCNLIHWPIYGNSKMKISKCI